MIKIGLIGCGRIAEVRHAPEYYENPNSEITAYYNPSREKAEKLAGIYGGDVFDSVEQLLDSPVDAVSVCVPNRMHDIISVQALKKGKHVLCEKPMAVTKEGCLAMLNAQKESGKVLMIGLNQRYAGVHVKAREIFQSGEMGSSRSKHVSPIPDRRNGRREKIRGFSTEMKHSSEQWRIWGFTRRTFCISLREKESLRHMQS